MYRFISQFELSKLQVYSKALTRRNPRRVFGIGSTLDSVAKNGSTEYLISNPVHAHNAGADTVGVFWSNGQYWQRQALRQSGTEYNRS